MVTDVDLAGKVTMKTFHSFCMSVLVTFQERLKIKGFTVYGDPLQKKIIKECILELEAIKVSF